MQNIFYIFQKFYIIGEYMNCQQQKLVHMLNHMRMRQEKAVKAHIDRLGLKGTVEQGKQ